MADKDLMRGARGDFGWSPGGRGLLWGFLGGAIANTMTAVPMQFMTNPMTSMPMIVGPAMLVGSQSAAVGWVVHIVSGAVFGALYGAFVKTDRLGRGALWGAVYGTLVGIFPVWLLMPLLLGMPIPGGMLAMLEIGMHTMWGAILGLITAWGIGRAYATPAPLRRPVS